jgi:hypothetical protein
MDRGCRIEVAGSLPVGLDVQLDRRFGPLRTHRHASRTVLEHPNMDQAALRAVLILLWDAGLSVQLATFDIDDGPPPGQPTT